jgi:hypothetical protein
MRKCLKVILQAALVVGFGATEIVAFAPVVQAADLGVTTVRKARVHHKRLHLVRDYDGTPVIVRLGPPVAVRSYDGTSVVMRQRYHQPVEGPQPLYYFNGQPVRSAYVIRRARIAF